MAGRTLIVTGASRRIGLATARMAAKEGWRIAVNYARDEAAARETVEAIEREGGKAVALKGDLSDGKTVVAKMKELGTDDVLFGKGVIDPTGRKRHDAYLLEVKKPEESKKPGDFYTVKATIPAKDAFRDPKDSSCPLVNKS